MNFFLTDQQKEVREEMLQFSRTHFNDQVAERDKNQVFDRGLWERAGEMKIQGLCIPKELGGRGLDPLTTVIALEAFGEGCEDGGLSFALAAHLFGCCVPIWQHGSERLQDTYLPKLCDGTWIAGHAMTERVSGSDVYQMETVAEDKLKEFVLNGEKTYVSNGPVANVLVTYAMTNPSKGFFGGITGFLFDKEIHAFSSSEAKNKMGVRTCHMGEIYFNDVSVHKDYVLGKTGGGAMIFNQSMEWERICLGAIHLGTMHRILEKAIDFVNTRKVKGLSIGGFSNISHTIAELKVKLESARWMTYQSAWKLGSKEPTILEASMTKLLVSELFKEFTQKIFQVFAGAAFREDHEAERLVRDAMGSTIYSGTSEVQKEIIAKTIGINTLGR